MSSSWTPHSLQRRIDMGAATSGRAYAGRESVLRLPFVGWASRRRRCHAICHGCRSRWCDAPLRIRPQGTRRLIGGRGLRRIDDDDLDWPALHLELEAELLANGGEQ